ncbi:MAG: uroporphyrinogen decarboxylase [Clostridiaceae bacterium]|jgi:uroporphyrinogen decarboxylase|nr:uroporphyrinogen decarboxylase [Clostridiaceae bacterium]
MTRRERVIKAVNHQLTDFCPYNIMFTQEEYDKVLQYLNDPDFNTKTGNHIIMANYDGCSRQVPGKRGYFKDDFGVLWNRNGVDKDIGVIEGQVINKPDISTYKFPEVNETEIRKEYENMTKNSEDKFRFGSLGFTLFERAWTLRGMEDLLADMVTEPDFVEDLLDAITDYNLKVIEIGLEYDIDGFHFGDDWGQQKGLIMGPVYWRKFIKPRMARMYAKVKSKGLIVSQHSCGDIEEIMPDLIEIGLDIYQTFQPEIYNIKEIKRKYGNDLTFWGGISTQCLLPFATPDEVKIVTRETIKIMGENGGYIAAPTHALPADIPAENVVALIEAFKNQ